MAIFSELDQLVTALRGLLGEDAEACALATRMTGLDDDSLLAAIADAGAVMRCAERIAIVGAGVVAARSTRDRGHTGLAQSRGHRSSAGLVQDLTGSSRAEAQKQTRLGGALLEQAEHEAVGDENQSTEDESLPDDIPLDRGEASDVGAQEPANPQPPLPWHAPLSAALLNGALSSAQHDAILRGLGEPPDNSAATRDAWTLAAEQLILETQERTPEELGGAARMIRDRLDPEGAARRYAERYERRSFRMYTDADGRRHANIAFEDEGAAWMQTIIDSALRPRRGGPRFVDSTERSRAEELTADPRTNEQLAYDLIMDVLRAGALADAESVFGTRQAGLRVVQVAREGDHGSSPAHTEDGLVMLPGWVADQHACNAGSVTISVDSCGNPLDVGREQRLFTPKQRIALAIRDGGCRWRGCDRPASYCEAHHIDHFAEGGRTDVDRGILLCRFHHMALHHGRWRITRDGLGDFQLAHPGGEAVPLRPRIALTYAWAGIDPPPKRFRPAA